MNSRHLDDYTSHADLCINGHIRLAGGRDTNEGRVEVCSNGVWGTIWDLRWDSLDAIVACRQLGLYQPHSSM
jgi:deleted-in-malignant-brain-tumors protein 1